jgi:ABC-type branched-subunit amino acid transport system substrate-binding protein
MVNTSGTFCVSRRAVLKISTATGAALAAGSVFAPAVHAVKTFKIGYVSPQTGPLAAFGEADNFVISNFLDTVKSGVNVGGVTLPVEVAVKDSQSNPNHAAEVAKELIVSNKIDLVLVASTPGDDQPGFDPMRDRGGAMYIDPGAVATLLHRPSGQSGWRPASMEAVHLHLSLLPGARGPHRGFHQHVGPGAYGQVGWGFVPERR